MTRIFLSGASGNVGRTIVRAVASRDGFELAGGWCLEAGTDLGVIAGIGEIGVAVSADLKEGIIAAAPDIVVDFSSTPVMGRNMSVYLELGLNAVIGTTGLTEDEIAPFADGVEKRGLRWSVIPNYGLGIALISEFVRKARRYYPYISITDQHTNNMANAPSGTAAALAAAAGPNGGEVKSRETYPGVLGGNICGVPVHSERLPWPGPYSGHIVTLARKDEIMTIHLEDYTSDIYMDGVFLAAEKLPTLPAGSFVRSLEDLLQA